jgi:spermidine/putrescine-binding protein
VIRRLAVLVALGLAMAIPAASAQTDPARLTVTATSDYCEGGLPVVDYSVTNQWSTAASAQAWWVADASVYGIAGTDQLGPAPDSATGSFSLPYDFYTTVTVYATATWPDGKVTTNASWAIPLADCTAPAPPTTTMAEPTTTTTVAEPTTTIDDGNGNGNGNSNGNGHGYGHATTTVEAG